VLCGWCWRGRGRAGSGLGGGYWEVEWDLEGLGGSLGSFVGSSEKWSRFVSNAVEQKGPLPRWS